MNISPASMTVLLSPLTRQTTVKLRATAFVLAVTISLVVGAGPGFGQTSIYRESFGGPGSVGEQTQKGPLVSDDVGSGESVDALKEKLAQDYGLQISADYNALFQHATESLGEDTAATGVARIFGRWTPIDRNIGSLVFKVEHRHLLGTEISPQELGPTAGYLGLTSVPFKDKGAVLNHLYWTHSTADNAFGFNVGIVDVTDYLDVYALVNSWTDFNNIAFTTNPTIPAPDNGFGLVARWNMTPNYYILAGVADANGDPTDPGNFLNSFFDVAEHFRHIEIGWISSWANRYTDNAHMTFWQVDSRDAADVPSGWGTALSLSHKIYERWFPFIRAGYSDGGGAIVDRSVSAGVGYQLNDANDFIGFGASWSRPPSSYTEGNTEDQYTFETYYRINPMPNLEITPSIQFIVNPALNPSSDSLWVPSVRLRTKL